MCRNGRRALADPAATRSLAPAPRSREVRTPCGLTRVLLAPGNALGGEGALRPVLRRARESLRPTRPGFFQRCGCGRGRRRGPRGHAHRGQHPTRKSVAQHGGRRGRHHEQDHDQHAPFARRRNRDLGTRIRLRRRCLHADGGRPGQSRRKDEKNRENQKCSGDPAQHTSSPELTLSHTPRMAPESRTFRFFPSFLAVGAAST